MECFWAGFLATASLAVFDFVPVNSALKWPLRRYSFNASSAQPVNWALIAQSFFHDVLRSRFSFLHFEHLLRLHTLVPSSS